MKTIEKKAAISKALLEVWEWKDEVYNDVKDLQFKEKQEYCPSPEIADTPKG